MAIVKVTKEHLPDGVIRVTGFYKPEEDCWRDRGTMTDVYTDSASVDKSTLDWVIVSSDGHDDCAMINIEALSALIDALTEIRDREDVKKLQIPASLIKSAP